MTAEHLTVESLTDYQRETLDKFLAMPGAEHVMHTVLVAEKLGMSKTFTTGDRPMTVLVAYDDDAHIYRHAIEGIEQAISLAGYAAREAAANDENEEQS